MPALSPTMTTGTINKWNIEEGQPFAAGDALCEIGTDKATIDFEAQDDGFLAKILQPAGDGNEMDVGVPICVVVEEEDDVGKFDGFVVEAAVGGGESSSAPEVGGATTGAVVTGEVGDASKPVRDVEDAFVLTPAARHLSQSRNVDATYLQGTGRGGRVTKGDVIVALESGVVLPPWKSDDGTPATAALEDATTLVEDTTVSAPPTVAATPPSPTPTTEVIIPTITTSGTYTDVPNNMMRKIIAKRLTDSKSTVPHFYASVEIELDEILTLRKRLLSQHDTKVSVNDIILKASALALRDVPELNSSLSTPNSTSHVTLPPTIDISVAVATPTGLITPILPNTDTLGLTEISAAIKDLAGRAREGKLQPEEYQGGSFCISNLGMFGINEFSAVINPPQAAILAVGGGVKRVVVGSPWVDGEEGGVPGVKSVMTARLSADRRVVDEPTVALYLAALRFYMNKPELLLL